MRLLLDALRAAGAKPLHERPILRAWLAGERLGPHLSARSLPLPAGVLAGLEALDERLGAVATVVSEHAGADGGARLLLQLADGRTVESVLLPREGVCVSTQVGCAVGCTFCQTGREGLVRQLTADEILAQVVVARRRRRVRRVVLMGMGEPAHNLPAVLEALAHLGGAGGFGHKDLVFSTVGEPRVFERLRAHGVKPALALSLHSTDAAKRAELLPRAPRVAPAELVAAAVDYARATGHPLQLQWTLLAGVNDGPEEAARLAEWVAGQRVVVNTIPWNDVDGAGHARPAPERVAAFSRVLAARGVLVKVRRSAAADVEGACGQLRSRTEEIARPARSRTGWFSVRGGPEAAGDGSSPSREVRSPDAGRRPTG